MECNDLEGKDALGNPPKNQAPAFMHARDSRKRKIPGLWVRNERFYACLWVNRGDGKKTARRFPLVATNVTEAREQMDIKKNDRRENKLPTSGRKPMLADSIEKYLASPIRQKRRKSTRYKDRAALHRWLAHIGNLQINRITRGHVLSFQDKRLAEGLSPRTVNLDLLALRGLLKRAVEEGHLRELPKMKALARGVRRKRNLITPAQLQTMLDKAREWRVSNGSRFVDDMRFLAFTGTREKEALRLKWTDVDYEGRRVVIGRDGLTKNGEERTVEFNPQLESLIGEMETRRAPDSEWLFPSPLRGVTNFWFRENDTSKTSSHENRHNLQ